MTPYETKDYIEQVMARLNKEDSELLEMRYWHKMKFREIGAEIGISHTRVEQKLRDVLKNIRWYVITRLDKALPLN
jgi:RNA polymerase sigma factor (sigma-70 family)